MELVYSLSVQLVLFLIACYFIFYKSWLKKMGEKFAEIVTVEEITRITESTKQQFHEQLESYKSRLNEELSLKIEPIKSGLYKSNITHQIQFSFLHQERAKIVIELYKKLVELHSAMVNWTAGMHPIIEDAVKEDASRTERAHIAMNDFKNFFLFNKLFLEVELVNKLDTIFRLYWGNSWDYAAKKQRVKSGELQKEEFLQHLKELTDISDTLRNDLPVHITDIENKLRKLLYVESEENGEFTL